MRTRRSRALLGVLALSFAAPTVYGQWDELLKRGREALGGTTEPQRQIAYFRIKGPLAETPVMLPPLFGGEPPLSLKGLLERFKEARRDANVVAVVVDLQDAQLGAAQLEEIHDSLRKFAAVDKPVFVHAEHRAAVVRHLAVAVIGDHDHVAVGERVPLGERLVELLVVLLDLAGHEPAEARVRPLLRGVRVGVGAARVYGQHSRDRVVGVLDLIRDDVENAPVARRPAKAESLRAGPRGAYEREIDRLQQELTATKEFLQSIIEDREAANEELSSANEELQSSNEELQSTNEELETAKEELQSVNEELTTVNEELQHRNTELAQANNDLNNLIASVSIPIVILGNDLRIRRFTPMAARLFNLLPAEVALGGGCTLYVDFFGILVFVTPIDATGVGAVTLPVPNSVLLIGIQVFGQFAVVDPMGSFSNLALTGGLKAVINVN